MLDQTDFFGFIFVHRYIAITKPFILNFWSNSLAKYVVGMTWLFGFLICLVVGFYSKAEPFITIQGITYYDCHETWSSKSGEQVYTVALFLIVFAVPLVCLVFVYGSISIKLWKHSAPGNAHVDRDNAQSNAKIKVSLFEIISRDSK